MENKERALAHIEKIEWVKPIEGANNIELIGVLGWVCVAKKGEFQTGDLAVYIEIDSNIYWELADKYGIENVLTKLAIKNNYNRVVLQGEGVGDVQGNPYKFKENRLYVFNLIIEGNRVGTKEMADFCDDNNLLHVPIISTEYYLPKTMEEMKLEADGYSEINPKVRREGYVYRSQDGQQSFKNVSREYLLKHNG